VNSDGQDGTLIVVPDENSSGIKGFLVPCETSEFGDFLSGLLKTPKIIRYRSSEPFVLRYSDLEDFFQLLNQRIEEQQKNSLISSEISIFYDDGTSYRFGTISEFAEHRNLSYSVCTKLTATIVYLVELPESDVPKKQEIQLTFDTSYTKRQRVVVNSDNMAQYFQGDAGIEVEIRHTHVTLGNDLNNVLKTRIKQLSRSSTVSNFMDQTSMRTLWVSSFGILGLGLAAYGTNLIARYMFKDIKTLGDVLQSGSLTTSLVISSFLTIFFAIVSMVVGFATIDALAKKPKAVIIISPKDEVALKASDARYGRRWILIVLSLIGTFGIGIFSSLVATGIWTRLFS
jgi:hypothetical protein